MVYKTSEEKRKYQLEYYYKNKEKVLAYQKARWKKKYQEDDKFRQKRQFRDKTRTDLGRIIIKKCELCGGSKDLQRHHPNYNNHLLIQILCRKCHNQIHNNGKTEEVLINSSEVKSVIG